MLNEKMYAVASEIERIAIHILPTDYQTFLFGGKVKLRDIILQILLDCSEYAYSQSADTSSLRSYRKQAKDEYNAGDAMRMRLQRMATDMNEKNAILNDYITQYHGVSMKTPAFSKDHNEKQYAVNDLEFMELISMDEINLLKVILDRKFLSPKFYNDEFKSCSNSYDSACAKMQSECALGQEKMVLNTLTMFSLEWRFNFDFLYEIVDVMQKNNVVEIPDMVDRITAFCYQPTITTALSCYKDWPFLPTITVTSRAVFLRKRFVSDIAATSHGQEYNIEQMKFLEALYLITILRAAIIYEDLPLQDWFCKRTGIDDWASVCEEYDVFQAFIPDKDWTNKKIRYAKNVYKKMTFDYTAP